MAVNQVVVIFASPLNCERFRNASSKEGTLHSVLGVLRTAQHSKRDAIKRGLISFNCGRQRLLLHRMVALGKAQQIRGRRDR